ncbi:MAG TPA: glucosidase [Anaerolineae bacterium]|nr:glucosidase [Anaerolineae bacterium]
MTSEVIRLQTAREQKIPWKKWGPYLSERQWGTVREDYSESGDAWGYFSHDQARSRAYRWGEDGLAGISDDRQQLCFALALWNVHDPILKERLFGLTNSEGNHGEDVKEYYFYLDNTPTHAYMKYLYKYPQAAYPYQELVSLNRQRSRTEPEYELLDTGVFDEDRYFDVFVEYAKASPEDILIKITVYNRGPEPAALDLLPTLWFRNTWSWSAGAARPSLKQLDRGTPVNVVVASHPVLGDYYFYGDGAAMLLFTENETNAERLFNTPNPSPYVKDGINNFLVEGQATAVNPERTGTKVAMHYPLNLEPSQMRVVRLRLNQHPPDDRYAPFDPGFDAMFTTRQAEADAFYESITPRTVTTGEAQVMRQALAGMLWSKQYYFFDLDQWLQEHQANPLMGEQRPVRNRNWFHMINDDIISMPDKWEYPWYAAWDLAFHTIALDMVDPDLAEQQLNLMLGEVYLHPNGQIPAYEWNFGDVNPPVHAWAILFNYHFGRRGQGRRESEFLKCAFQKLLLNFTWWVNRKDPGGRNVFEGGFLGLDNIGVFDRSSPLPTGGYLEQADGTAWMALFSQNMLELALVLSLRDPSYEPMTIKFLEHFLFIAAAMDRIGDNGDELWDEADGFFYDLLRFPDGTATRLKVRSMVGLLPLAATTVLPGDVVTRFPHLIQRARNRFEKMPELVKNIHDPQESGYADRRLLAVLNEPKLRRVLARLLDENEFLSPYGIRALSRCHLEQPYIFNVKGQEYRVDYLPAESDSGMFGGNSNWRGPIWLPVNALILRGLLQFYMYYGTEFTVECPTGSGNFMNLFEVGRDITRRLSRIFLPDETKAGRRAVYGSAAKFQTDLHWRDYVLFYEYFDGDTGAGLGASHQTGWTGLIAKLIQLFGCLDPAQLLEDGPRLLKDV